MSSEQADAVVVGGGVQGAAAALHLLQEGVERVKLLERDEPFEATSSAGAGFVTLWAAVTARPYGREELAVEHYGLEFYRELEEEGDGVDFLQNGFLMVASGDAALDGLRGIYREEFDPDTVEVDAGRVEQLTGGTVLGAGVRGGLFQPAGAQVFTPAVGRAIGARVRALGGSIEQRRPALGLLVEGERVTGVRTEAGAIACETVVLAAGAWTNELLSPLGVHVPHVPQLTSRIITEPLGIPSTMPALMLFGAEDGPRLWIRQHEGGLLWGGVYLTHPRDLLVGAAHIPTRFDEIPIDGVRECERVAREVSSYLPALGRYKSIRLRHGAPCYTPDHRAIVGPVPGIEGLWVMAGDNEAGVTHGPGFAKALAERIVRGTSDFVNLEAWRMDRFDGSFSTDREVAEALATG